MSNLSSGQIKKISIIRALLSHPKILLLDEVTSNLEERSRLFLFDFVLNELNKTQNVSVIWTTHYPNEINQSNEKSFFIRRKGFGVYHFRAVNGRSAIMSTGCMGALQ